MMSSGLKVGSGEVERGALVQICWHVVMREWSPPPPKGTWRGAAERACLGVSGKPPRSRCDPHRVGPGGELGGRPGVARVTSTSSPLLTGTPPQSAPRCGPPAQPCWPVCRGPRTPLANTWPARPRAWSCASVSDTPSPPRWPPPLPLPAPGPRGWHPPGHTELAPARAVAGQLSGGEGHPCSSLSPHRQPALDALCPPRPLGGGGPSPAVAPTPFAWLTPTGRDLPPQQPPPAPYQHWSSAGLNRVGPSIHGYFSVVNTTVLQGPWLVEELRMWRANGKLHSN